MTLETPEPDHDHIPPHISLTPSESTRSLWSIVDLLAFAGFFLLTLLVVSLLFKYAATNLFTGLQDSVVAAVVVQGIINLIVVGFIFLLVRLRHGFSFRETIHWYPRHQFTAGMLITLGTILAIAVLVTSALFPVSEQTPIEKFLSSAKSLYVFAIFGIAIAPLFEEIIFRGFLFKVFSDMAGPGAAIGATATLFALLHALQLWGNWPAIALIFVVGFVLAFIRERSSSLIPGLIVHTAYNATLFAMYAFSTLLQKSLKLS